MPVPSAFAGFGGGVLVGMRPASVHLGHTTPPGSLSMSKDSGYCMQLGARAGDTGGDGGSEAALQAALLSLAMPGPLALQLQLQLQLEVQMHADVDTLQSSDWSGVGPYEDQDPDCPYDYDLFSPGGEGGDTFQDHCMVACLLPALPPRRLIPVMVLRVLKSSAVLLLPAWTSPSSS